MGAEQYVVWRLELVRPSTKVTAPSRGGREVSKLLALCGVGLLN